MNQPVEEFIPTRQVLLRLLRFMRPFMGWVALSTLLGVATIASAIGLLGTSAYLIAQAAMHPSIAVLQVAIVGVRFFGISRGVFRYGERLVTHEVNFRLLAQLRTWFYQALEPLAPARLMNYQSGDLLSRGIGDIETLENFYVRAVAPLVTALIVTIGMSFFVGRWDVQLGGILAGGLLLSGAGVPWIARRLAMKPGKQLIRDRAALSSALVDGMQGMAEILAFGQGDRQVEKVRRLSQAVGKTQMELAWAGGAANALSSLVTNLTLLAVLAVAIPLVSSGKLDGFLLAVISLLVISSFEAVTPLPQAGQQLESSLTAARRLFAFVAQKPAAADPFIGLPKPNSVKLKIHGLEFRYAPNLAPALCGIDLELPAGKKVAVVGDSGAGKSTLIHLLLRFWDFQAGGIELDGQDIRCYAAEDVRAKIGVISQSTYLFTTTIRQNLLLACPTASPEELAWSLRQAGLEEWLFGLPEGLDTWTGEHGVQLSGGERQRLAVARTLLKGASLVLMDEPAAHLDPISGRRLMQSLKSALVGRSILLVTHRLDDLEDMDEIVLLKAGRIVERGRHADLLALNGLYAAMWRMQNQVIIETGGTFSN